MEWKNQLQGWQGSVFVLLTPANLYPMFPGQMRFLNLLCWLALPTGLCNQALLRYTSSQVFWQDFLVVQGWVLHSTEGKFMYDLASLYTKMERPDSMVNKALCLSSKVRQICALSRSLVFRKDAWHDFDFLKFVEPIFWLLCDLSWKMFHVNLKWICILLF